MSFRARVIVAAAAAVAVAVALASVVVYFAARSVLRDQIDDALRGRARGVLHALPESFACLENEVLTVPEPRLGRAPGYIQIVCAGRGEVRPSGDELALPVSTREREVAEGTAESFFADADVGGTHVRVLTVPAALGVAVQVARPLDEVDGALRRLRFVLGVVALGGIGLAAGLGLVVARAALTPVRRLTRTAEDVARTKDLSHRVDASGEDELARLAATFNTMLAALADSQGAQRRLVLDASHELRTPLTSLRTNVEVLARAEDLEPEERERLRRDVLQQVEELSALVADVVELAHGEQPAADPEPVRLDLVAAEALERARRNWPSVDFRAEFRESTVTGVPPTLERAIGNLLDNAAKWSRGAPVEMAVRDGEVAVRDHGTGFAADDVPRVFDRFYRSADARGTPGSGLGLAIVRQVAEAHGGTAEASNAAGGGALVRLRLPPAPACATTDDR